MLMHPEVDNYLSTDPKWQKEVAQLRKVILDCGLTETWKWQAPCYTYEDRNIILIQPFKAYCAVLFFKGYLLSDAEGVLVKTGANTKVGRQLRFANAKEVVAKAQVLKAYIYEAIEVERAGLKAAPAADTALTLPAEFQDLSAAHPALKAAFEALTPGRQKAYCIYFSAAKQSKTRISRIEKYIPRILEGKGLMDR